MKGRQGLGGFPQPLLFDAFSSPRAKIGTIRGACSLRAGDLDRVWICEGTSVDYTISLPPAAHCYGRQVTFIMSPALTKLVTVDAVGAEQVGREPARTMWANETLTLRSNGLIGWDVRGEHRIPMRALTADTGTTSCPQHAFATFNFISALYDVGGLLDTTNKCFRIRRASTYRLVGSCSVTTLNDGCLMLTDWLNAAGGELLRMQRYRDGGATLCNGFANFTDIELGAGDTIRLSVYTDDSGGGALEAGAGAHMSIAEIFR